MRKWWMVSGVILFMASCSEQDKTFAARDADRIEIIDTETGFSHTDTSKVVVKGFRDLLNEPHPKETDCPTQGTLIFKRGEEVRLKVGYYKDASACNMLVVEQHGKRFGYPLDQNTLVYLALYFQNLKKKYNAEHHKDQ